MHLSKSRRKKLPLSFSLSIPRVHRSHWCLVCEVKRYNLLIHYSSLMTMHHSPGLTNTFDTHYLTNTESLFTSPSLSVSLIGTLSSSSSSFVSHSLACIISHLTVINLTLRELLPLQLVSADDSRILCCHERGRGTDERRGDSLPLALKFSQ